MDSLLTYDQKGKLFPLTCEQPESQNAISGKVEYLSLVKEETLCLKKD
jgi:hypothetical protein